MKKKYASVMIVCIYTFLFLPYITGGGRVMILSPGVHTFPFKLGLPLGLPSTFLAKHGWVQYYCKAELKEASGLTHKNQQVFIVMNPIDLNLEPSLLMVSIWSLVGYLFTLVLNFLVSSA